ncbi:hypothetical protein FNF28_01363 [Cafeteria roenbergensis]|uniref:COMMD1 N-terminal domain-containing protein n=2 Tax=Cafeteria roenbergensis TaxID=33653 RepID=A0A5A8E3X4_CAFRO|nr:hypothetical protein FNF28_01363 [Cafeteria roenbergensis]
MAARFDLSHDLDAAHLGALLKGIVRMHVIKDSSVTPALLQEAAFDGSGMPPALQAAVMAAFEAVLCAAAKEAWTPEKLAAFVSEEAECSAETAEALRAFWEANRTRCRTALVQRAAWGETPLRVAWRVEIEAGASQSLRKQASDASDAAGSDAAADAGGEAEGEATASVEITLAGRAAPGQRAGEGAQSRGALSFKASREALVMLRDRLAEAEAAAAAMC